MGCFLISFCLGNTLLPLGVGLPRHPGDFRRLLLRQPLKTAQQNEIIGEHKLHFLSAFSISLRSEIFHQTNDTYFSISC